MKGRTICISPPGEETYDVNITVSWAQQWTAPTGGSWTAAPTRADKAATPTAKAVKLRDVIRTVAFVYNATAELRLAELFRKHCPVTEEDLKRGFVWSYLSEECDELLSPYCNLSIDGPEPTRVSVVPEECLPAAVMGW